MYLQLLLSFWREIIMAFMTIIIALLWSYYPNKVKAVEGERDQYIAALDYQNFTLLQEAEEHARKLAELPKEITKIRTKYEVIYAGIDQWKGDTNASDCKNADSFLRSFNY